MMKKMMITSAAALSLAGCATSEQGSALIFARTQTFGVTIAGSVPDQGAQLTMGFGDRNLAVVPTTQSNGEQIRGTGEGSNFQDALSVLGQFEASGGGGQGVSASLGTFFSTGNASRVLAQGFSCRLGAAQGACGNPIAVAAAPTPTTTAAAPTPATTTVAGGQ